MTSMPTRPLGTDDLQVSAIGLGCNNFGWSEATRDAASVAEVLGAAEDCGITLLDTANVYGGEESRSEQLMGEVLRGRRDRFVIASKWGHDSMPLAGDDDWGPKGSRGYVRRAVEGSLRRLRTDWIDLWQFHSPDPATSIEETLEALRELVTEGKIRFFGHSNFSGDLIRAADDASRAGDGPGFVSAQSEYSLLSRGVEADEMVAVNERGLGFLPYFPLASGLLTGKYRRDDAPAGARLTGRDRLATVDWGQLDAYADVCREIDQPMSRVSVAWLLGAPGVTSVIAGATSAAQVRDNAAAASVELDPGVREAVTRIFD